MTCLRYFYENDLVKYKICLFCRFIFDSSPPWGASLIRFSADPCPSAGPLPDPNEAPIRHPARSLTPGTSLSTRDPAPKQTPLARPLSPSSLVSTTIRDGSTVHTSKDSTYRFPCPSPCLDETHSVTNKSASRSVHLDRLEKWKRRCWYFAQWNS